MARLHRTTAWSLALVGVAATALTGCAGKVAIADPEVGPEARQTCALVLDSLPRTVLQAPRRDTTPGQLTTAWGDPPITLTCGVAESTQPGRCFEVDGVGWFAQEGEGGWLFTTADREVPIQLGVPSDYAPEANALVEVTTAISTHDPQTQPCI